MAKKKLSTADQFQSDRDRIFERAERKFEKAIDAMAATYVASAYDALLREAARLQSELPPTYLPDQLPDGHVHGARFPRLLIDRFAFGTVEYMDLVGRRVSPRATDFLASYRTGEPRQISPIAEA